MKGGTDGDVAARLHRVVEEIRSAAARAGRSDEVSLVAVSKTVPAERVLEAYEAGQRLFGENRVQEGMEKRETLRDRTPDIRWHLIGRLQTNKVKPAVRTFDLVQSVDSLRLAEKLGERAGQEGRAIPALIEVNIAGEVTKAGFTVEALRQVWAELLALPHLDFRGLMTVAPQTDDPDEVRPLFATLRRLRDEIREGSERSAFSELSMGMSGDFVPAIEEGATIVRIGRAIFGERLR